MAVEYTMIPMTTGQTMILINTNKSMEWWRHIRKNTRLLTEAVNQYCGPDKAMELALVIGMFDSDEIVRIVSEAMDAAPDDIFMAGNKQHSAMARVVIEPS